MNDLEKLEKIALELITSYEITTPPVPIESMLKNPKDGMWKQVDVNQLSGSFISVKDRYSPRMSLARLLVRHVATSEWGKERQLQQLLIQDENHIYAFARMLVMPASMISSLSTASRNPTMISMKFEVPEDDARQRMFDLVRI
ncbi:MAG: hypothetical protein RLP44_13680 [Aggregatilineales bacterium]